MAISIALVAWVLSRIQVSDRSGIEVRLHDGRTLIGEVVERTPGTLVLRDRRRAIERVPQAQVISETPAVVEPGFLAIVSGIDLRLLLPLMAMWFVPVLLNTHRWALLLRMVGVEVTFRDALRLSYAGIFFNNFMLGSTGGDVLKAVLVARDTEHKTRAVASIFVDRVLGMLALALVAMVAIGVNLHRPELREAALVVGGFVGCLVAGTLVYFNSWVRSRPWLAGVLARLPFGRVRAELDHALHLYHARKGGVLIVVGISLVSHLSAMVQAWGFLHAAGAEDISLLHVCSYVPVIMILSALPISVGGLGVGEAAWVHFFGPLGLSSTHAVTVSLLGRLTALVLSLPGGGLLLLGDRRAELARAQAELARDSAVAP